MVNALSQDARNCLSPFFPALSKDGSGDFLSNLAVPITNVAQPLPVPDCSLLPGGEYNWDQATVLGQFSLRTPEGFPLGGRREGGGSPRGIAEIL